VVVVLHLYIGLPLTEVAEVLGIPTGTARSRLHTARRHLRAALGMATDVLATTEGQPT
jgi:RNA polymerase sigma-70 factor (ECF subfamily)